jgi:septal ring factor EnvC (AmiA/AmiB activator)
LITEIIVVALIALLGSLAGAGMTAFVAWRKWPVERVATEYNAAAGLTQAAAQFIDDLRAEIEAQRGDVDELKKQNKTQSADLDRLRHDLVEEGKRIHKLEHENSALRRELETEREKRRNEVKRLEACIGDLEAQNNQLSQENAELRGFYEQGKGQ